MATGGRGAGAWARRSDIPASSHTPPSSLLRAGGLSRSLVGRQYYFVSQGIGMRTSSASATPPAASGLSSVCFMCGLAPACRRWRVWCDLSSVIHGCGRAMVVKAQRAYSMISLLLYVVALFVRGTYLCRTYQVRCSLMSCVLCAVRCTCSTLRGLPAAGRSKSLSRSAPWRRAFPLSRLINFN